MATNIPPPKPLSYEGQVVVPYINRTGNPASSNNSFSVPTIWVNTSSGRAWILTSKALGVANWVLFAGGQGVIHDIITPTGDVQATDGAITFANGINMNIVGSGSTITFNAAYEDTLTTHTGAFVAITTLPVPSGSAITLQGRIIGSNVAHTEITGGDLMVVVDEPQAAIIGFPVINVETTSTGIFRCRWSAGNLLVEVRATSSATYNWKHTYTYTTLT